MKVKLPDAVKLAALVLCDTRENGLECGRCPIDMGEDCDAQTLPFARRILAAWRKPAPRTARRAK